MIISHPYQVHLTDPWGSETLRRVFAINERLTTLAGFLNSVVSATAAEKEVAAAEIKLLLQRKRDMGW